MTFPVKFYLEVAANHINADVWEKLGKIPLWPFSIDDIHVGYIISA